jgi:hypothetical protein
MVSSELNMSKYSLDRIHNRAMMIKSAFMAPPFTGSESNYNA